MQDVNSIGHEERERRAENSREAMASLRLEGLAPGRDASVIFERYVDGALSLEQMGAEIDSLKWPRFSGQFC